MSTASTSTEQITRDTDEALARNARGERDPVRAAKSLEELSRSHEEIRKRVGTVDIYELIRDARNQ